MNILCFIYSVDGPCGWIPDLAVANNAGPSPVCFIELVYISLWTWSGEQSCCASAATDSVSF